MAHKADLSENFLRFLLQLRPDVPDQSGFLDQLQELSSSVSRTDLDAFAAPEYVFETKISSSATLQNSEKLRRLRNVIAEISAPREPAYRAARREVPLSHTIISDSQPDWAAGSSPERIIGPLAGQDGRQFWIDFYAVVRLIPLYLAGQTNPALLFYTAASRPISTNPTQANYALGEGSLWVRADLLADNAPADGYVGFNIQSGELVLSNVVQDASGKLTIPAGETCAVSLKLHPVTPDTSGATNDASDVKSAALQTPDSFAFHFSQKERKVESVGRCGWTLFGQTLRFEWNSQINPFYDAALKGVVVPFIAGGDDHFRAEKSASPFAYIEGSAVIVQSGWLLNVAMIDVSQPTAVSNNGGIALQGNSDLSINWRGLRDGPVYLPNPWIVLFPNILIIVELQASNRYASQRFRLWQSETSAYRSSVEVRYGHAFPLFYAVSIDGAELVMAEVNADAKLDRPVDVRGHSLAIRSRKSLLILMHTDTLQLVYLYDNNVLLDSYNPDMGQAFPEPIALALHNALFTVSPVNGFLFFAELLDEEVVEVGNILLLFGLYGLLPTLPDPYAANDRPYRRRGGRDSAANFTMLLLCHIFWRKSADETPDTVETNFHLLPLNERALALLRCTITEPPAYARDVPGAAEVRANATTGNALVPEEQKWNRYFHRFFCEQFALMDVSTNADWMGVSLGWFDPDSVSDNDYIFYKVYGTQHDDDGTQNLFPLQVDGLDLTAEGRFIRAFTVPQNSWEPLINLTPPVEGGDPPNTFNFYPDDGGPTRLFNNNPEHVPIAPLPKVDELLDYFNNGDADGFTGVLFTLPFGLRAFAEINKNDAIYPDARLQLNQASFRDGTLTGALQIQADAPERSTESPMFIGGTLQLNNIVLPNGTPTGANTLGHDVSEIFNNEFFDDIGGYGPRGVPLTRIDFSGYGTSTFSRWENPLAAFAQTSQARFDIFIGRTAHEVIQVKSVIYPWGIRVVRTIVIFRASSSYVYRYDTGWQAETPGLYDFSWWVKLNPDDTVPEFQSNPYVFHPGIVKGVYNVRNIADTASIPEFTRTWVRQNGEVYVDEYDTKKVVDGTTSAADRTSEVKLSPVYFDADVDIDFVKSGSKQGKVPSKGMLGYVQLAPKGQPIPDYLFRDLLRQQFGSLGGPVDCVINIGETGQKMRVVRADVSESVDGAGTPIFVSTARGSVVLPKDGSWSAVQYLQGTGEVSPLPDDATIPLIRQGILGSATSQPLRLENPMELLRIPTASSIFFGFLQSTGTQKALFRKPRFEESADELLSEIPDFSDAYRMLNSAGIFPNLDDAIPLDLGSYKTKIIEEGYKLLDELNPDQVFEKALPDGPWYIVNEDFLKIYIEYDKRDKDGNKQEDGFINFGIDSAAANMGQRWLSKMNNIGMIVDLGPLARLMMIKGRFNAEKGAAPAFQGPELEFSDALQPVIDILQILLMLQGGDYKEAFAKGLEIAMSNSADSWEYAFHARKEIPLVRFPPPALDSPTAPLKLEASLGVGVYFNEVFAITDSPGQLIPSVGAFLEFYGRLSVMCVSVAAATVYATGSVDLRIAADIKTGPSLMMKFGFGAEINVGLPVVGNVSLLYMVGVDMTLNSVEITIGAFLLFRGRAEILGGIVTVTITIEASGKIQRLLGSDETNMIAQVTFGLDISIFLVINISFSESWQEARQLA